MQKKIIALAVAAAFSAPAFADNANVTWYGKAFVNLESVNNDKITAPAKTSAIRAANGASRLGVKGSEDLGSGLSAIWQYEAQFEIAGGASAFAGTRNSGIGLSGAFGQVIAGNWDTPFKTAHNKIELFDNTTSFTALNLIGRAGNGAAAAVGNANYNTRQTAVVEYWTPKFGALQGAVSYSPDATPETTSTVAPIGTGDQSKLSFSGTYEQDAIYASAAYERRTNPNTGAGLGGTTDSGLRLVGKYTLGDYWVGGTIERITVNTTATASFTQSNLELVGQYKLGAHKFAASYAKAGATNVAATGANQLSLRYGYDFSKRTEAFAAYTSLKNDTAGGYSLGNIFGSAAQQTGSTQSVIGAGLIHSF